MAAVERQQTLKPIQSDTERSLAQLKFVAFAVSTVGLGLAALNAATIYGASLGPGYRWVVLMPGVGAIMVLIGGVTTLFDIHVGSFLLKASSVCVGFLWLFCTLFGAALPLTVLLLVNSLAESRSLYEPGILLLNAWLPLPSLILLYVKSDAVRDGLSVKG